MQEQLVVINGSAGAFTSVPAIMATRYFTAREDESGTPVGLIYQLPDDNFTATYTVGTPGGPDVPQITRGHINMTGSGDAPMLGYPAQNSPGNFNYRPADILIKIKAKGATPCPVRFVYYE